ncbi:HAD family hydrolase [Mucilaginibacter daejeonensis]|uniref:D-glycero-alpha-D-manno-heptose-1,7-bisphosphate 7-phosphatase n=1 Tax=Mucilaginibacter daejeonensis TaxID=398049 RepID=UPI001D173DA2|nr:HAD family hydrolase [Mucilaginibacter daejeonensis]UEG54777.1 HAD family hydrolase [Mucilaginibacter daejeonensis]
MNKAIFLDKDGTLIPDIPYNVDPALITLQPGSADGLQRLLENGYIFIVITNQSGVARGMFHEHDLQAVEQRMQELLATVNIPLTAFYYCPHHPDGTVTSLNIKCDCRKPLPGMILRAAREHNIELSSSWMIGDILNDVEAGNRAGCKTVLIDNGNETEWLPGPFRTPTYTCHSIDQAANEILSLQLA